MAAAVLPAIPATADAVFDPCSELVEADEQQKVLRWQLFNLFRDAPDEGDLREFGERDYHVTIRAGRFANVSCNENEFEFQEMYPIGIMVKPLYRLDLPRYEAAGHGRPILVLTEYGHRKIVSEDDILPLENDRSYVFADSYAKSMICRSRDDCPGNSEDLCASDRCRYDISAKFGYAVADTTDEDVASALSAYDVLHADRLVLQSRETPRDAIERAQSVVCEPFPVRAYLRGGDLTQPQPSYLTLCAKRAEFGADADGLAPLKVVNRARADRVFGYGLDGSFHRRFGEGHTALEQALAAMGSVRFTTTKPCGVEITNAGSFELAGGLNVKADAGIVEVSLGAQQTVELGLTETLSEEDYLLFSTYFIEPIPNVNRAASEEDDLWLYRILFRSRCENGVPRRSSSITVFYERLPAGKVEIAAEGELFRTYTDNWANLSFAASTDPAYLQEGQFWQIVDHIGYFIWRDTLREYFYRIPGTSDLVFSYPVEQRPMVRDFFVYLMLAAAYHHLDP